MLLVFCLLLLLLIGQVGALIHYDLMVKLGLQESKEIVGDMGVAINKGFAAGDTIIYAPLIILGMIGLWFKKTWGMILMAAAFGISAYWPMVCLHFLFFSKGLPNFHFTHFVS